MFLFFLYFSGTWAWRRGLSESTTPYVVDVPDTRRCVKPVEDNGVWRSGHGVNAWRPRWVGCPARVAGARLDEVVNVAYVAEAHILSERCKRVERAVGDGISVPSSSSSFNAKGEEERRHPQGIRSSLQCLVWLPFTKGRGRSWTERSPRHITPSPALVLCHSSAK